MFFIILLYTPLIIVLILAIWWFYHTSTKFWKLCVKIPGPVPFPVIGNGFEILRPKGKLVHNFLDFSLKYSLMCRFFLGNMCFVLLHDVDDIKVVFLSKKTRSQFVALDILERFLGKSLLSARRDDWKKYRRLMEPALKGSALKSYVGIINKKSEILVNILKRKCNEVFDIRDTILLMTVDTIIQVVTGTDMKIQEGNKTEFNSLLTQGKRYVYKCLVNPFYWLRLVYNNSKFQTFTACASEVLCKYTLSSKIKLQLYDKREVTNQSGKESKLTLSIADHIIKNMNSTCFLEEDDFMVQLRVLEAAGSDTLAIALSNCLKLLGFHKEIQTKIVKELNKIFGDNVFREAEHEDLRRMIYTEQVIKEALRLFPPAYIGGRRVDEDIKIGGYTFPAGTNILISPFLVHRNPNYYPDPLKFDPERFSPENIKKLNPHSFIPFSAGPRNCIGNQYAMFVLKIVLSHILRHFEILQYDNADMIAEVNMNVVLTMKHGYKICLKKRYNKMHGIQ